MSISVREARTDDLDAVAGLYVQLAPRPPYPEPMMTERDVDAWHEMLSADRLVVLVAEQGNRVIGTACLLWMPSLTDGSAPTGFIENMVVDQDERRKGIGRALIDDLLRRATEVGCRRVQLLSHKARADDAHRFYTSVGFVAEAEGFRIALGSN